MPDIPDTEVISVAAPAPVFVDSTGRRSRLLRRLAYAFGALVMLYGGLISVSLAGGPVRSSAVLPLPGLEPDPDDDATKAPPKPNPVPAPTPTRSPTPVFVTDALPRRTSTVPRTTGPRLESATIVKTTKAAPATTRKTTTPTPKVTTTKPTESTTTPTTTPPTTTPTTTPPVVNPAPPLPPAIPTTGTSSSTGGQGGGSTSGSSGGSTSGSSGGSTGGSSGGSTGGSSGGSTGGSTTSVAPPAPEPPAVTKDPVETTTTAAAPATATPKAEVSGDEA